MFPAATKQGGQCFAFPDTCKTQVGPATVPIPYPNMAMMNQANPATCSKKVKIVNKPVILKNSMIPTSMGDEAGALGGVISGQIKGPVKFQKGSTKVKIEGQPAVHLTCMTAHNGNNANMPAGCHIAPSQTKVIIMG